MENIVKEVEAQPVNALNSDHAIVTMDIKVRMAGKEQEIHGAPEREHSARGDAGAGFDRPPHSRQH